MPIYQDGLQLTAPTPVHLLEEETGKVFLAHNLRHLLMEGKPLIGLQIFNLHIGDLLFILNPDKCLS